MFKLDRERVKNDTAYREEIKLRCQTDILFLARMLGYDKVVDRVHQAVADLFVHKNPALDIEEQDRNIKDRLHLDPRGTFKSTFSIVDSVQWIINFANVRICKLTATKPLAVAIAGEITDKFVAGSDPRIADFQLLFPEFLISARDKRVGEYTAPCRTRNWREATVMAFSIETTISGWHFDVMDPDDIVDTLNSSTAQGVEKVKKNWRINRKTCMPWAYRNYKGTRYGPFELWGDMIDKADPKKMKVLIRGALVLKDGRRLEPGDFPPESDMDLLFPELLSYEFLKKEFEDDYSSFMTQYMNDAYGGHDVTFTKESMLAAMVQAETTPVAGEVSIAWRFAYDKVKHAGAAVGVIENGRMYIVDVLRGIYKPSSLAHAVVKLAKKHGTHNVTIEETPGARYYESAISNYAAMLGWAVNINWLEYQEDDDVRDLRMKGLEPLVTAGRLLFSDSIVCLKDVFAQFSNYGMMDATEIPDVVERVCAILPKSIVAGEQSAEQDLNWELVKQRDMYDRTHGVGKYALPEPAEVEAPYAPPKNDYGLDEVMPGLNG